MAIVSFHLEHKTMNCLCPFQLNFQRKSESNYSVSSLLKSDDLKQRFKFVVLKKIPLWKNGLSQTRPTFPPLACLVSISQRSLPVSSPNIFSQLMVISLWNKFQNCSCCFFPDIESLLEHFT
ncbi:unnamed protein product [Pipistrellus nathusii]|uniref:Uncharacterized protein n=1 Tax=Pipistrellus nathusii TaxID=59473 RepID=A0ABP0AD45_PIPNA